MLRTGQFTPQLKLLCDIDKLIMWSKGLNVFPTLVEFDLSNACNHNCSFCTFKYINDKSSISKEVVKRTIKDLSGGNVKSINWTGGGEPTIHKDFIEIVKFTKDNGIKQGLFTNGSLLDIDKIDAILDTHDWVRVSIDAGTKETFKAIKGVDDFDNVLSNVKLLMSRRRIRKSLGKKSDTTIGIGFVITPDNYHEMYDFVNIVKETGVDYGQFKPCINDHTKDWQYESAWWRQKVIPVLEDISSNNKNIVVNTYKFQELLNEDKKRSYSKCYGHAFCPCIGATGDVWLCTHMRDIQGYSLGNLYKMSFEDIWNSGKRKKIIDSIDFSKCQFCCKNHEINKALYIVKHPESQQHGDFL